MRLLLALTLCELLPYLVASMPVAALWVWLQPGQAFLPTLAFVFLGFALACNTLLLAVGVLSWCLPRPAPGVHVFDPEDAPSTPAMYWWVLQASLHSMADRSPARWVVTLFPVPAGLYFWLAGARIHPTVAMPPRVKVMDPWLVEIGARTVVGDGASLAGHVVARPGELTLGRMVVGEDVVIGAYSIFFGGCEIGDGARLLANSVVRPGTVIGPGEVWGGSPARRIRSAQEPEPGN